MADRKELINFLKKADYKVWAKINHVSRSGMLRHIDLLVILDNRPQRISASVAQLLGYSQAKDGSIKVNGCGMNMAFHLVYSLSCKLYCEEKYTQEGAYKLKYELI